MIKSYMCTLTNHSKISSDGITPVARNGTVPASRNRLSVHLPHRNSFPPCLHYLDMCYNHFLTFLKVLPPKQYILVLSIFGLY